MTAATWASIGVAIVPLYGLIAGWVARLLRRYSHWHVKHKWQMGRCDAQRCGCCGPWRDASWLWPLVMLVLIPFVLIIRPALRLYRITLNEETST